MALTMAGRAWSSPNCRQVQLSYATELTYEGRTSSGVCAHDASNIGKVIIAIVRRCSSTRGSARAPD